MRHSNFKIYFNDVQLCAALSYDVNVNDLNQVAKFAKTFYNQDLNSILESSFKYQKVIDEAIKSNNLDTLEVLWSGIYYHDVKSPNYEYDVYTAANYGNLRTFQHVLYAYMNYSTYDGVENLNYNQLLNIAQDQDVLRFIRHLSPCVKENKLGALNEDFLEYESENDHDEDKEMCRLIRQFYELVRNFN